MSVVLVTGAAGQLGRAVVPALRAAGHTVRTQGRGAAPPGGDVHIRGDLRDPEVAARAVDGVGAIVHLAGGLRGGRGEGPEAANVAPTASLLVAARRFAPEARWLAASSAAVHGCRAGATVDEAHPARPDTAYGRAKVAQERLLTESRLPVDILRFGAIWGAGLRVTLDGPLRRGPVLVPGDGLNLVPLLHIDDAVETIALLLAGAPPNGPRVLHVADPSATPLGAFWRAVAAVIGRPPPRFLPLPAAPITAAAAAIAALYAAAGRRAPLGPDTFRLLQSSVRLNTARLDALRGRPLRWPDPLRAVPKVLSPA